MGITYEYKDNNQVIDRSNVGVDFSMSDSEIVKSEEYLNNKDKVLEWGAGGSTLYFSNIVSSYVSIEHDKLWYNKLTSQINDNVELLYVSTHDEKFDDKLDKNAFDILRGDESWYKKNGNKEIYEKDGKTHWTTRGKIDWHCYLDYIKKPLELSYRNYDVVLVDGRARAMCAYVAKDLLKDDGYLLFHDFNNRGYYHGILKYYEIVDMDGTLAILIKK